MTISGRLRTGSAAIRIGKEDIAEWNIDMYNRNAGNLILLVRMTHGAEAKGEYI